MKYQQMLQKAIDYNKNILQNEAYDRMMYFKELDDKEIGFTKTKHQTLYENAKNINTNDSANIIRTILPEVLEVFLSSTSISVNTDDDAEKSMIQKYNEKNIFNNPTYVIAQHKAIKAGLIFNKGIIKVCLDEKFERKATPLNSDEEILIAMEEMNSGKNCKIIEKEDKIFKVEIFEKEKKPAFYYVDFNDFFYIPDNDNIIESSFIANRISKPKAYFIEKENEGIFQNVQKIDWNSAKSKMYDDLFSSDKKSETEPYTTEEEKDDIDKLYDMFECYTIEADPITGDMKHYIVNICGNQLLTKYENPWQVRPFGIYVVDFGVNSIEPESLVDWVKEFQKTKTTITRQYIDNLIKTNNIRPLVSPSGIANNKIKVDSILNNTPGYPYFAEPGMIDFNAARVPGLGNEPLQAIQYMDNMIQDVTGINKYVQGQQSASLNKTATGIRALLGQSQKRIRMIIRLMVETGFGNILNCLTEIYKQIGLIINEATYLESENGMGYADDEAEIQKYMALQPLYMQALMSNNPFMINFTKKMFEKFNLPTKDLFPEEVTNEQIRLSENVGGMSGIPGEKVSGNEEGYIPEMAGLSDIQPEGDIPQPDMGY